MSKKRRTAAGFCCASTGCISALEAPGVEGEGAGTGASAPKLGKKAMITISTKLMAVGPENEEGRNAWAHAICFLTHRYLIHIWNVLLSKNPNTPRCLYLHYAFFSPNCTTKNPKSISCRFSHWSCMCFTMTCIRKCASWAVENPVLPVLKMVTSKYSCVETMRRWAKRMPTRRIRHSPFAFGGSRRRFAVAQRQRRW